MGGTRVDIPYLDLKKGKPFMATRSEPRAAHQMMIKAKVFMVAAVRHTSIN